MAFTTTHDNRVGRLGNNCTGWLTANGAMLRAGHCNVFPGEILEVNVPASQADGTRVAAAVQDQFPVLAGSITRSQNTASGNDWIVCRLGRNSLGQSAHVLYGFFRVTRESPSAGAGIRITGGGVDNTPVGSQPTVCGVQDSSGTCTHFGLNAQNQTLQTATGTLSYESGSGDTAIAFGYAVDSEPANSGSPIIWEANGFATGIHTNGGCSTGGGANSGTSFELDMLENALAAVPGPNCRYLDTVKGPGGFEDGSVYRPHDTLAEAITATPAGGRLSVVTGSYSAAGMTITKPMTISAPVGAASFGN